MLGDCMPVHYSNTLPEMNWRLGAVDPTKAFLVHVSTLQVIPGVELRKAKVLRYMPETISSVQGKDVDCVAGVMTSILSASSAF